MADEISMIETTRSSPMHKKRQSDWIRRLSRNGKEKQEIRMTEENCSKDSRPIVPTPTRRARKSIPPTLTRKSPSVRKSSYAEVLARAESWGRNYRNIKLRIGPYQPPKKIDIVCSASENIMADNRRHIYQSYYFDDPGAGLSQDSSGLTGVGI
jgi:hypothetical protein